MAIVGRPNTGKSTLVNRVLGHERMIVSEVPGTTRDAVDAEVMVDGEPLILIDTAGIRRRGRLPPAPSVQRPAQPEGHRPGRCRDRPDRCDRGFTAQDAHVVGYVLEAGKGLVLVINKWDVIEKDEHTVDEWLRGCAATRRTWSGRTSFGSAMTGQRVERILREARRVAEERYRRVPTADVNRVSATPWPRIRPHRPRPAGAGPVRDPGRGGAADVRHLRERPGAVPLLVSAVPREPAARRVRVRRDAHPPALPGADRERPEERAGRAGAGLGPLSAGLSSAA